MQSLARVLHLLLREQWRGGAGVLGPGTHLAEDLPGAEAGLVAAAAALGAGEPKRALRVLGTEPGTGGDHAAVDRVLRKVAATLEHNWFPGGAGAVLEPGVGAQFTVTTLPAASADAALLVDVATLVADLPTYRTLVGSIPRGTALPGVERVIPTVEELVARLDTAQAPMAVGPVALMLADLNVRCGQLTQAGVALQFAVRAYQSVHDPVGIACCALAQGDWSAEPSSHPELLGENIEGPAPQGARMMEPDPGFAAERYAEAERRFADAGADRGLAAVALRRAALAARSGDAGGAAGLLDRCRALADAAGDGALARLAAVHRGLLAVDTGEQVPVEGIAADVAGWAGSVGSRSFARGLARLCHARARNRGADVIRAGRALRLAEAINDGIGAVTEPALVRSEFAAQYGAANFRRAALVLTLLDLTEAEQATAPACTDVEWARLVELGMSALRDANALADAPALEQVGEHLVRIAALDPGGETGPFRQLLELSMADAAVLVPRYQGVAARAEGDLDEADRLLAVALDRARARGPGGLMIQATVLGTMRRFPEALAIVRQLVDAGVLPLDLAATFFARLEDYPAALDALDRLEQLELSPAVESRPWERPALRAEALVGAQRAGEARPLAELAVARFEEHLTGLSRDVLRTMASDDLAVAGLYTTAIRAHLQLHAAGADPAHAAAAFTLSDRCRGSSLTELVDLDLDHGAGTDPRVVGAVRGWLRAGAELARTIEGLGGASALARKPVADVRRTVRAAERALDDAEADLAAAAPTVLARRLREPVVLARIQERLEPGTLLVQFHAFDDQLVSWAVTRDSVRMVPAVSNTPLLAAQVRRFHRAVADPASTRGQHHALGRPLTELLLAPLADELAAHHRVVIVPFGALSVLPFHVLPRDGSDLASTHVVSYLPAAGLVPEPGRRARRVGADATTLVVGDPVYGPDRGLQPLPGAAVEAAAVGRLRSVAPLLGPYARRKMVLRRLAEADIAHLATHGLLVEAAPYSAELALVGAANLTVPDLMGLDTNLSLAVLSACDSGRGRATAAGDVVGLTRSLMAAGAAELVVSLWPVDDQLGCLAMVRFHQELMGGAPPAQALAAASLAVRGMDRSAADTAYRSLRGGDPAPAGGARSARTIVRGEPATPAGPDHPYYWAPFVHVGV